MVSLKKKLGTGLVYLSGGDIVVQGLSLAYLFLILSHLQLYEYGLLKLALSIPALLSFFSLTGIGNVLVADLSGLLEKKEVQKMRSLLSVSMSSSIFFGLLGASVLFVSTYLFVDFFNPDILNLVRVLSLMFLIGPIRIIVRTSLNVTHNFRALATLSILEESLKFFTVFVLLAVLDWGVLGVIVATVIASLISNLAFLSAVLSMRKNIFEGKLFYYPDLLKPLKLFSLFHANWTMLLGSLHSISINLRPWIIQFTLGLEAVAIYGLAVTLLSPLQKLVPVGRLLLPILPSYMDDERRMPRIINSAIKYKIIAQTTLVLLTIGPLFIFLKEYLPEYLDSFGLFVALTLTFIPNAFSQLYGVTFHVLKMQKNLFYSTATNMIMVIIILPTLIYLFGIWGVAIEMFATQVVYVLGRYRFLKKTLPAYSISYKDFFTVTYSDKALYNSALFNLKRLIS